MRESHYVNHPVVEARVFGGLSKVDGDRSLSYQPSFCQGKVFSRSMGENKRNFDVSKSILMVRIQCTT